jgi:hypothetical protein
MEVLVSPKLITLSPTARIVSPLFQSSTNPSSRSTKQGNLVNNYIYIPFSTKFLIPLKESHTRLGRPSEGLVE